MLKIFIGKSASGKDFLLKKLVAEGNFQNLVTFTTRPMREGEVDGIDYHFVTEKEFKVLEKAGKFLETRKYNTLVNGKPDVWYYGSPVIDIANNNYAIILDVQGTRDYIDYFSDERQLNLINITYVCASKAVRTARAQRRGGFDASEWARRLIDDDNKFTLEALEDISCALGKEISLLYN